ncbi:MAG: D-tyrosyl-tRNA(Tyr) deacylase [Flavobacteriales bacterium]|nr:D-tyrosyl-tRNA(Tyr) deacylase [Flavobacteriales bacterium]
MRVVVQRVLECSVHIEGALKAHIGHGLLVYIGISHGDAVEDLEWLCGKLIRLRVFPDDRGVMNKDVIEAGGSIMLVSQFTLHASTRKGNRPSYMQAARPEEAIPMYLRAKQLLSERLGKPVQSGEFGADMKVGSINDGPVTIVIDSVLRE